jgi:cell division protein FtsZ
MGLAMMGTGISQGEGRAREAAMKAITSPLLEDVSIDGAKGVLMNISCGPDLTIDEVSEAANIIHEAAHEDAKIYFGTVFDSEISDEMRITVIATGIGELDRAPADESSDNVTPIAPTLQNRPASKPAVDRPRERKISPNEAQDLNVPAYLRKTRAAAPAEKPAAAPATGGEEEFIFDEEDFEIPSFIRMQAD